MSRDAEPATIQDQTRQTLELLRSLIDLLLDQQSLREGPPLEDLIATLIVQQRQILTIAQQIQGDLRVLGDRLGDAGTTGPNAHAPSDRRGPGC
jgi:hypothetical protein